MKYNYAYIIFYCFLFSHSFFAMDLQKYRTSQCCSILQCLCPCFYVSTKYKLQKNQLPSQFPSILSKPSKIQLTTQRTPSKLVTKPISPKLKTLPTSSTSLNNTVLDKYSEENDWCVLKLEEFKIN